MATTAELFEQVTYPRNKVYAPCWGANHNHPARAIGTCKTCKREVVINKGRILNVHYRGENQARKFCCWSDSHSCVAAGTVDAQTLFDTHQAIKVELEAYAEECKARVAKGDCTQADFDEMFGHMSDLGEQMNRSHAAILNAGLHL